MDLSLQSVTSFFESWGDQISPSRSKSFSSLDWQQEEEMATTKSAMGEAMLAVSAASLGGAIAAAGLGSLFVLRESGDAKLPWQRRTTKVYPALTPAEWRASFDTVSGRMKGAGLKAIGKVRLGGCSNSIRGEVWCFLLGLYDANSTAEEREAERDRRLDEFLRLRRLVRVIRCRALQEEQQRQRAVEAEELERKVQRKRASMAEGEHPEEEGVLVEVEGEKTSEQKGQGEGDEKGIKEMEGGERDVGGGAGKTVEGGTSGAEVKEDSEDVVSLFSGVLRVSEPPSLEASTESFIEVCPGETQEVQLEHPGEEVPLLVAGGRAGGAGLQPAALDDGEVCGQGERGQGGACLAQEDGEGEGEELGGEWVELSNSIPAAFKKKGGMDGAESGLDSFLVWRRIMRLDAVRMNTQWLPFSVQTYFPEDEALDAVEEAEIKSYDHLGTAARWHAARLVNILEAYAVKDPEIGYCQGMTDLLSPFVAMIEDDSEAFACFSRFMETARHNFRTDEVGIRKQLDLVARILEVCDPELFQHLREMGAEDCIFVYRMVIVLLRRELSFEQTITLWEVLWAESAAAAAADAAAAAAASVGATVLSPGTPYCFVPARSDFFLFVVAAIIVLRRGAYMKCEALDEVLRLCNSLAGELDVWELVEKARNLVALYSLVDTSTEN